MNMTLDGLASQGNGEGVALHMTAFGSAYEFNTSLASTGERVVYREVLARIEGVMFGQELGRRRLVLRDNLHPKTTRRLALSWSINQASYPGTD